MKAKLKVVRHRLASIVSALALIAAACTERAVLFRLDAGVDAGSGITPGFIRVDAGQFQMGSPVGEPCRDIGEIQHSVELTRAFELGAHEVTRREFLDRLGYSPAPVATCAADNCPAAGINRSEAAAYCNALSSVSGLGTCYECTGVGAAVTCVPASPYVGTAIYDCTGFRLPTEAEWERAYRADSTEATYAGAVNNCVAADATASAIGWYDINAASSAHPVGSLQPNAWGFYDMAGNVWEWVHDGHVAYPSTPVVNPVGDVAASTGIGRGGSFNEGAGNLRAAFRNPSEPFFRDATSGFRCARSR